MIRHLLVCAFIVECSPEIHSGNAEDYFAGELCLLAEDALEAERIRNSHSFGDPEVK